MKILIVFLMCIPLISLGQTPEPFLSRADLRGKPVSIAIASPLDTLSLLNAAGKDVEIKDGTGRIYFKGVAKATVTFIVGGSLGKHIVSISGGKGNKTELSFDVKTQTNISGDEHYNDMFKLFVTSMQTDTGSVRWNGNRYRYFVPWGLDHCHTMKGLKYFYDFGDEFVDLMREAQRSDGMIWSFVEHMPNMDYWRTRDAKTGYTKKIGDKYFVRQPTENHPEYIFVKTIYQWWKVSGDDNWMEKNLSAASKALNYCMNDPARWSDRFKLLKRVYTIDSWDFQVDDKYTPDLGITKTMIIDPNESKFGIFFGDNTAYIMACRHLAEMYEHVGKKDEASMLIKRAEEIEGRLNALSWNGKFYTHFIEEDSTVKRDLGVDEKSQLAQSNAYSLNRGISHEKSKAIIESYLHLKQSLPVGSPGEWYAIYPPFERGFEIHGVKWQYMNGGVGGHVAGELARGAFENGYEQYATDILERLYALGKKYNNKIYFAYTGSFPPIPKPTFKEIDLLKLANMDSRVTAEKKSLSWMNSAREGDDFRNLPTGRREFAGIPFNVIDPAANSRKAVVAVSRQNGFPSEKEIVVNSKAGSIYLLHTSSKPTSENVASAISFHYADGTSVIRYILMGKQLAYWWFSQLKTDYSGIAWYGENNVSKGIGLSWCAIDNPYPKKTISKIMVHAAQDQTIYTLFALTLSSEKHYVPTPGPSFGGPDNWAAATAMAALIEGLVGVKDSPKTQALSTPALSPRWIETEAKTIRSSVYYPASDKYVAYKYTNVPGRNVIKLTATSSANSISCHVLLPQGKRPNRVEVNGNSIPFTVSTIEKSNYADFTLDAIKVGEVEIGY